MPTQEEIMTRLLAVEEELRRTKKEVNTLKKQLELRSLERQNFMKQSGCCPVCHTSKIFYIERPSPWGVPKELRFWAASWGVKVAGIVRFFVCATCGHIEARVEDPEQLEGKKYIRVLKNQNTNEGPYR